MSQETTVELFKKTGLGKVERTIAPNQKGRVFFEGTYWPARWHFPTEIGIAEVETWVTVLGRQGLTLLVQPNRSAIAENSQINDAAAPIFPQQSLPTVELLS
ncbi:MAG: NfeD family protein [Cyanobacteria bacterium P01_A01_bin.123]